MSARLLAAMRAQLNANAELQKAVRRIKTAVRGDEVVAPTTTGYLHQLEGWTAFARNGEYTVAIELALDPPDGAYEWCRPTEAKLSQLKSWLGCDHLSVFAIEVGKVRYFAAWNK